MSAVEFRMPRSCPFCQAGEGRASCAPCRGTGRWPQAPDPFNMAAGRWQGPLCDCTGQVLCSPEGPYSFIFLDLQPGDTFPHRCAYLVLEQGVAPQLILSTVPPAPIILNSLALNLPIGPDLVRAVQDQAARPARPRRHRHR